MYNNYITTFLANKMILSCCFFLEQLEENNSVSDSKETTDSASTNYFLQYMGTSR